MLMNSATEEEMSSGLIIGELSQRRKNPENRAARTKAARLLLGEGVNRSLCSSIVAPPGYENRKLEAKSRNGNRFY
jgi:hypothetical protein